MLLLAPLQNIGVNENATLRLYVTPIVDELVIDPVDKYYLDILCEERTICWFV